MSRYNRSLFLSDAEVAVLQKLAEIHGCLARTSRTAGQPSWRAMIKRLAAGGLDIVSVKKPERPIWWIPCTRGELTDFLLKNESVGAAEVDQWLASMGEWTITNGNYIRASGWD